jgi:hypothetical protein
VNLPLEICSTDRVHSTREVQLTGPVLSDPSGRAQLIDAALSLIRRAVKDFPPHRSAMRRIGCSVLLSLSLSLSHRHPQVETREAYSVAFRITASPGAEQSPFARHSFQIVHSFIDKT